jgi:predicted alpha/beta superfamily hydrolase
VNACSVKNETADNNLTEEFTLYSNAVQDSFVISVQLPEDYYKDSIANYPVVFLLDANFHFPMLAATVRQYEKGELLPPLILGIGYKSFQLMDSLRVRDYMYPAALPSDEMNASGSGKKFDKFITTQLIPYIDSNFKTNKSNIFSNKHQLPLVPPVLFAFFDVLLNFPCLGINFEP